MAISRVIYTQSLGTLTASALGTSSPAGITPSRLDTIQNATFTLTIPRADVNVFGVSGVVARPQLEAESATIEVSLIPITSTLADPAHLTAADIDYMIGDTVGEYNTVSGSPHDYQEVKIDGIGHIDHALMNTFGGDATVGALPTFTFGWLGRAASSGTPAALAANNNVANVPNTTTVATPEDITGLGSTCIQSATHAWDMPVELVLCLSGDPSADGEALSNPPGTSSLTVEGTTEVTTGVSSYGIGGNFTFDLVGRAGTAQIDSRTQNLAVGELFGTFNYVMGATADGGKVS
jgi:hypothetical protein